MDPSKRVGFIRIGIPKTAQVKIIWLGRWMKQISNSNFKVKTARNEKGVLVFSNSRGWRRKYRNGT